MSRTAIAIRLAALGIAIGLAVLGARLLASPAKPSLVIFSSAEAPLAQALNDTLSAAPVQALVHAHFASRRVDSRAEQALFRRWTGASGVLASVIVDDEAGGRPDVLGVLPGYADADRYSAFLDDVARHLPKLRELRDQAAASAEARLALGQIYAEQGSHARARSCFESIGTPAILKADALEHLARLDVEAGRTAQARTELERARSLGRPAEPVRFIVTEALLLSSERRVSDAVALLSERLAALPSGTERARGWLLLGKLEHELQRDPAALADLERARGDARDARLARSIDEQIFHVQHPEPGHQH